LISRILIKVSVSNLATYVSKLATDISKPETYVSRLAINLFRRKDTK
jgi:hypothetical protein